MDPNTTRILVVEDEPELREIAVDVLSETGARVAAAHDFPTGFAAIQRRPFDLVVANIVLPGGNGIELAHAAHMKGARALLITGHAPAMRTCLEAEIPCLMKPFRWNELLDRVAELISASRDPWRRH